MTQTVRLRCSISPIPQTTELTGVLQVVSDIDAAVRRRLEGDEVLERRRLVIAKRLRDERG